MLRRIEWIRECGNFEDYRWGSSLPELARINVIYGPNGMGKTSLATAFDGARQLDEGFKRISLDVEESGARRSTNGGDDPIFDRLHVFSDGFTARSHRFHEGSPNIDAVLTLGEKTAEAEEKIAALRVELATRIDARDQAKKDKAAAERAITQARERVSKAVVGDLSRVEGYRTRGSYSSGVVARKYAGDRTDWAELSPKDLAAKKTFVSADKPEPLDSDSFTLGVPADLKVRSESLLKSSPVTIVLDTLRTHPEATAWVSEGRELHKESGVCLYCGSALSNARKHDIEQHFSDAVASVEADLDSLAEELASIRSDSDELVQRVPARGLFFEDLREQYDSASKGVLKQAAELNTWIDSLAKRVKAKRANVLGAVVSEIDDAPDVDGADLEKVRDTHNKRVDDHAALLIKAARGLESHHLKAEEATVDAQTKACDDAEETRLIAAARIEEIETEIASLENVEGDPTPTAEVLTREVARLLGRSELTFLSRDGKYVVTRDGEPAIGLSAGERTAIALVHFLEGVARHDASQGKPIVVIDDPVSSLDSNVFMGISTYIWSEAVARDHVEQVVVLTHNFDLFKQWDVQIESMHRNGALKKSHPAELYELKSRHIARNGRTRREPVLVPWPESNAVRKKVRSSYHHAFIAVAHAKRKLLEDDSLENRLDAQLLFPNVIRRLLESFLAFKRPEWVGDFTDSMRKAGQLLDESGYKGDSAALRQQLTRYAHAYSHSQTPETDGLVSPDEIGGAISSVFVFMDQLDHAHFVGLCTVVGVDPATLLPERPQVGEATS